jgi:RNA polymerase sigma-70 factor (ECF subfamily)
MDRSREPDVTLVRAAGRGDRRAVVALFDRYVATVTRYAWAIVANRQDVEEIVQDTFVTLWRKAGEVDLPDASILPWLLVVSRNHAANLRRSQRRHQGDELPDELVAPSGDDAARDRLRWVRDEIDALSPIDRQVCELCLIDGRSYADAAAALGLSVGAVRQRVARSRARIRKAVTHDEY